MFQLKKATRSKAKMRVGFFGPSGAGKTMSALKFAHGLVGDWGKIAVIDTEQGSADLYSDLGEYQTLSLTKFSPDDYVDAIKYVESVPGIECLIIDSISHEWEGVGGCLDIHAKLGGRFEQWAKVTPKHNSFIQAILQSKIHVLVTGRTKIDYDMSKDEKSGKARIEKVGHKAITREGLDYELTLSFRINQDHLAVIDKDRTNLFNSGVPFMISEETGKIVHSWNESGAVMSPVIHRDEVQEKVELDPFREVVKLSKEIIASVPNEKRDASKADLAKIFGTGTEIAAKTNEQKKKIAKDLNILLAVNNLIEDIIKSMPSQREGIESDMVSKFGTWAQITAKTDEQKQKIIDDLKLIIESNNVPAF